MTPAARPVPEGVAAPDGATVYVPALGGGVAALATGTGEARWQSALGRIAIHADARRVLVLADAGAVQPRWLSAFDGSPAEPEPPPWPAPPGEWWLDGVSRGDGELVVTWHTRASMGRSLPPVVERGAFAVALDDPGAPVRPVDHPQPPPAPCGAGTVPFADAAAPLPPWLAAGIVVALGVRERDGARELVLCRLDGDRADEVPIWPHLPKPGYLQAHDSPDASLLTLMATNDAPVGDAPPGSLSTWRLYSVPDGAPLATLPAESGLLPPFCRVDDVLLVRQLGALQGKRQPPARALRAWRLPDRLPLWTWALPAEPPNRIR